MCRAYSVEQEAPVDSVAKRARCRYRLSPTLRRVKLARSRGIQRIRMYLDSELVVDQVNGRAKVGKEHLRALNAEACSLLQEFPNIRISWVPRKWNAEADALATKALLSR